MLLGMAASTLLATSATAEAQAPRGRVDASFGARLVGIDLSLRLDDRLVASMGAGAGGARLGGPGGTGVAGDELGMRLGVDVYVAGEAFRGLWVRVETTTVVGRREVGQADPAYATLLGSILLGTTWTLPSGFGASAGIGATRGRTLAGGREQVTLDVTLRLTIGVAF
ncbi:MAG: hypothetical protein AAGH15_03125 [Myxococcota bacterium]